MTFNKTTDPIFRAMLDDCIAKAVSQKSNPDTSHPLVGDGRWTLNDEQLFDMLSTAALTNTLDAGAGWTAIYGFLDKHQGYAPFFCVRSRAEGDLHLLIAPTLEA